MIVLHIEDNSQNKITEIIQDYIDGYMCWHNIDKCPPTTEKIKEWLMEEI